MVIILMSYVSNYYDCPKPKYYYGISYFFLNIYIYIYAVGGRRRIEGLVWAGGRQIIIIFFFLGGEQI